MSDNMNGWIRASERMPLIDDADECLFVWVFRSGKVELAQFGFVINDDIWAPKPKAVPPAPPKIEEKKRRTCWRNLYPQGGEHFGDHAFDSRDDAEESSYETCLGQVEFREVLPNDPTQSELLSMIEALSRQITGYRLQSRTTAVIDNARTMLKMLARE